ncbi:hypothetical protein F5888DRAFT_1803017 [Russula emetica]|nr:hypothetical protein F5888DRAFT_1803017 [Russula emetica]
MPPPALIRSKFLDVEGHHRWSPVAGSRHGTNKHLATHRLRVPSHPVQPRLHLTPRHLYQTRGHLSPILAVSLSSRKVPGLPPSAPLPSQSAASTAQNHPAGASRDALAESKALANVIQSSIEQIETAVSVNALTFTSPDSTSSLKSEMLCIHPDIQSARSLITSAAAQLITLVRPTQIIQLEISFQNSMIDVIEFLTECSHNNLIPMNFYSLDEGRSSQSTQYPRRSLGLGRPDNRSHLARVGAAIHGLKDASPVDAILEGLITLCCIHCRTFSTVRPGKPEGSLVVDVRGGVSAVLMLTKYHPQLRFVVQDRELLELKHTDLADSDGSQNAHDKGRDKALSADPKVDVYTRDRLAIVENT